MPATRRDGGEWPTLSVVSTNYNYARYLEYSIRSILLQGYPRLEYIVIDGGSTDGSVELLQRYSRWISHWISERDSGTEEALNKGFAQAHGEIAVWLGSDDAFLPGAFEIAVNALVNDRAVVIGDVHLIDAHDVAYATVTYPRVTQQSLLRYWVTYSCPSSPPIFFRRALLDQVGLFDPALRRASDLDLWLRISARTPFHSLHQPIACFRIHPESKSGQDWHRDFEAESHAVARRYWGRPWQTRYWQYRLQRDWWYLGHFRRRWSTQWLATADRAAAEGKPGSCWLHLLGAWLGAPRRGGYWSRARKALGQHKG